MITEGQIAQSDLKIQYDFLWNSYIISSNSSALRLHKYGCCCTALGFLVLQIARIHSLEQEFSVKITIDRGHRLNRIRIQGEGQAIVSVHEKIYAIFAEVEEQQREEYHAEIIAQQVRAYDGRGFQMCTMRGF